MTFFQAFLRCTRQRASRGRGACGSTTTIRHLRRRTSSSACKRRACPSSFRCSANISSLSKVEAASSARPDEHHSSSGQPRRPASRADAQFLHRLPALCGCQPPQSGWASGLSSLRTPPSAAGAVFKKEQAPMELRHMERATSLSPSTHTGHNR